MVFFFYCSTLGCHWEHVSSPVCSYYIVDSQKIYLRINLKTPSLKGNSPDLSLFELPGALTSLQSLTRLDCWLLCTPTCFVSYHTFILCASARLPDPWPLLVLVCPSSRTCSIWPCLQPLLQQPCLLIWLRTVSIATMPFMAHLGALHAHFNGKVYFKYCLHNESFPQNEVLLNWKSLTTLREKWLKKIGISKIFLITFEQSALISLCYKAFERVKQSHS